MNRVEHTKAYRDATGCTLRTAFNAVEAGWRTGDPIDAAEASKRDKAVLADMRLRDAAPELLAICQKLMPTRVCITNPNVPDSFVVPIDVTMGELRQLSAALAKALGQEAGGER